MGPGGHILTFPVNHGDTLNIVAFKTDDGEWPDSHKLTRPAERKDLLRDFENWSKDIVNLLNLTEPNLDIVSTTTHTLTTRLVLTHRNSGPSSTF